MKSTDIDKWARRFQRVLDDFPDGYWIFCADATFHIMKCGPHSSHIESNYGVDPEQRVASMHFDSADGGIW